jgi:superfamily II DNA/RNA helicase
MAIPADILKALERAEYKSPTPIQSGTIPQALQGVDILGCAQTGTGKTAAFLIPLIAHLQKNPSELGLVLAPTREIALQICESAKSLLRFSKGVYTAVLIGGSPMRPQIKNLQRGPKLIIGTPGRIFDHMMRGTLSMGACTFAVLDEADQMLDMGFAPQIDKILCETSKTRQTLMFSATMPPEIMKLSRKYLKSPESISVGEREKAVDTLKQKVLIVNPHDKETIFFKELSEMGDRPTLIFAQTQWKADELSEKLQHSGFRALSIHGGLSQGQRFYALKLFKSGQIQFLVATDVASRGLHIDNIENVVNYEVPLNPESFLHRIGRTARNGKEGMALTLVDNTDFQSFRRIKQYLKNCEVVGEFLKTQNDSSRFKSKNRRFGKKDFGRFQPRFKKRGDGQSRPAGDQARA